MGDVWVHVRMRKCCRDRLRLLDDTRKLLEADPCLGEVACLEKRLGELSIPAASKLVEAERGGRKPLELERRVHKLCLDACREHEAEHASAGETKEAGFWTKAGDALSAFLAGTIERAVAPFVGVANAPTKEGDVIHGPTEGQRMLADVTAAFGFMGGPLAGAAGLLIPPAAGGVGDAIGNRKLGDKLQAGAGVGMAAHGVGSAFKGMATKQGGEALRELVGGSISKAEMLKSGSELLDRK